MKPVGNRIVAIKEMLSVVDYVQDNQNSDDMERHCETLIRTSIEILLDLLTAENVDKNPVSDTQGDSIMCNGHSSSGQCCEGDACDVCESETPVIDDFNIQNTISKIKTEMQGEI